MIKQRKKRDCACSGHPSGQPKVPRGVCFGCGLSLRPAVRERIRSKRVVRAWSTAIDLDEVED